jgi:hypothetical protein
MSLTVYTCYFMGMVKMYAWRIHLQLHSDQELDPVSYELRPKATRLWSIKSSPLAGAREVVIQVDCSVPSGLHEVHLICCPDENKAIDDSLRGCIKLIWFNLTWRVRWQKHWKYLETKIACACSGNRYYKESSEGAQVQMCEDWKDASAWTRPILK